MLSKSRIIFMNAPTFILFIGILLLGSCNSAKFVPEGKYLLNKVSVKVDDKRIKKQDLKTHVRQKENLRILGWVKFHLGLYNLSSRDKESGWLKRIGEAPVIYEESQSMRSKQQLRMYLINKGYYNASINDSVTLKPKRRKANLVFDVKAGDPYLIRNYSYAIKDEELGKHILKDSVNQLLKSGDLFDVDILNAERQRIATSMKDEGYYQFTEEFISFSADTSFNNHTVDLTVNVEDASLLNAEEEVIAHQKYKIRHFLINPTYQPPDLSGDQADQKLDTLIVDDYIITYAGELRYKPTLFSNVNRLRDSTYYSLRNAEKTYRAFNRLKQFKVINISFDQTNSLSPDSIPLLDARFQLSPLPRKNFSVDIEGTNSSGNLGVAGNFNFQHRNVFKGAEVLDFKIRGARERQQAIDGSNSINFNTQELGFETSLTIPKFLSFIQGQKMFNFQIPETKLSAGYNYQKRPDYKRTITNLKFGYNWKSSAYKSHTLNVIDLNYVILSDLNQGFINSIRDLYIKSSFTDHLISATNYSWMYNTQRVNIREDYTFFKVNLESAGNLLSLFSNVTDKRKIAVLDPISNTESSHYEVIDIRFAQYLKGDFEYRYGHMIDKQSSLVGRAFVGLGIPFGNFDVLPFEKKYFTGGANGIRAWQVRSLGPGTYRTPQALDSLRYIPNQSSDLKLEANLEYRFKMFWIMEGAFFLDAGNIWAINSKDNREGAVFKIDEFYKQIAIGTGMGLRLDFTFFLFRLDLGLKMRDPSLEPGKRFIPGNYPITGEHVNLSFAIGYPF